mgnify:CR=1 FL=1
MELKDFIKAALTEITSGIIAAQKETKDTGVIINPSDLACDSKGDKYMRPGGVRYVQEIEINVSVTSTSSDGSKTGLHVIESLFSGDNSNSNNINKSCVNTIKLKIPVALPMTVMSNNNKGDDTIF